jgi:RNA-binding protein Musashi
MNQDAQEDEDDDDVDFNLGGGSHSNSAVAVAHDTGASTPPYGTVHKSSAKDDG